MIINLLYTVHSLATPYLWLRFVFDVKIEVHKVISSPDPFSLVVLTQTNALFVQTYGNIIPLERVLGVSQCIHHYPWHIYHTTYTSSLNQLYFGPLAVAVGRQEPSTCAQLQSNYRKYLSSHPLSQRCYYE